MRPAGYEPFTGESDEFEVPVGNGEEYLQEAAKKKRGGWRIVFIIAVTVLAVSLIALAVIAFSYVQGQHKYDKLAANLDLPDSDHTEYSQISVDWDTLLAINPDTVAWIYVPGTNINYPVVRGKDNEYYLTHDFDGDQGWLANFGAIFMDYRNAPNWQDDAYFIYGHHMNDGSMFADVANMADQSRFDASRTVYLLSPQGNFKLRTFALIHCDANDPLVQITFNTPEEMAAYVQDKMNRSLVSVHDAPEPGAVKQVFAFATCDSYSAGRYVLYASVEDTTVKDLAMDIGSDEAGIPKELVSDIVEE